MNFYSNLMPYFSCDVSSLGFGISNPVFRAAVIKARFISGLDGTLNIINHRIQTNNTRKMETKQMNDMNVFVQPYLSEWTSKESKE